MAEFNENLWAPWRIGYIREASHEAEPGKPPVCFLCEYILQPEHDVEHHVVWRSDKTIVLLNRFPYTSGHLLVAPVTHVPSLETLADEVLLEVSIRLRDGQTVLRNAVQAQGFNIGANIGRCAGAGLPDHVHWHVVPRWNGDTNFMSSVANTRVIPEALDDLYHRFIEIAAAMPRP
jgi:ATP adenylyltransferase